MNPPAYGQHRGAMSVMNGAVSAVRSGASGKDRVTRPYGRVAGITELSEGKDRA